MPRKVAASLYDELNEAADTHDLNVLFEKMKELGGCSSGCRLMVFSDIAKLGFVVRHVAPGAAKPDDTEIPWDITVQADGEALDKVVAWLRGLHGVGDSQTDGDGAGDSGAVPNPDPSVPVSLGEVAPPIHELPGAGDETAPEAPPAEDGGAEGPH